MAETDLPRVKPLGSIFLVMVDHKTKINRIKTSLTITKIKLLNRKVHSTMLLNLSLYFPQH